MKTSRATRLKPWFGLKTWLGLGLLTGMALFYGLQWDRHLTLEALKLQHGLLLDNMRAHPVSFGLAFFVLYGLTCALPPPLAAGMTLVAGNLYGVGWGLVWCVATATLGATGGFLSARYLFRDWLKKRMGKQIGWLDHRISHGGFAYLLFLRVVGLLPFFFVNLAMGLTHLRATVFMGATALGMLPITLLLLVAGQELGQINSPDELLTPRLMGPFVLLGLLIALPVFWRHKKKGPPPYQP